MLTHTPQSRWGTPPMSADSQLFLKQQIRIRRKFPEMIAPCVGSLRLYPSQ